MPLVILRHRFVAVIVAAVVVVTAFVIFVDALLGPFARSSTGNSKSGT